MESETIRQDLFDIGKKVDREKIVEAFIDLLDGVVLASEMEAFTGLSEDRCNEIYSLFIEVLNERGLV